MEDLIFTSCFLLGKKRDTLLLKGYRDKETSFIKAVSPRREDLVHALLDEYSVMSRIRDLRIPRYLGLTHTFSYENKKNWVALYMEYVEGLPLSRVLSGMKLDDFLSILLKTGQILGTLLSSGVLYTDLNPGNILVRQDGSICLTDYTGAWFYRHNPNPDYSLRFSYRLCPELPADQLLIQELALMLNMFLTDYLEKKEGRALPSSIYVILETGLHPTSSLTLKDFLEMLE